MCCAVAFRLLRLFNLFSMASSVAATTTGTSGRTELGPLVLLTDAIVGSPERLAEALAPLLEGRSSPFTHPVPAVPRVSGGSTKPFPFIVAHQTIGPLHPASTNALFPGKFRLALHAMSAQQIAAFQAWSDGDKVAYALLYSVEEWEANKAECRRVAKTANKAANRAKKLQHGSAQESAAMLGDFEGNAILTSASGTVKPTAVLTGEASPEVQTMVSACILIRISARSEMMEQPN